MSDESGDESGNENSDFIGSFDGSRNEAGERHGDGKTLLPNKDRYEGGYFSGMRQGQGQYQVTKKGQVVASYDGEWLNGQRHGTGTCLYSDGSKYSGSWEQDSRHGEGTMEFSNGQLYRGRWKDGLRDDQSSFCAQFKHNDGDWHYGGWKSGALHGPGMILYQQPAPAVCLIATWDNSKVKGLGFVVRKQFLLKGHFLANGEWRVASQHSVQELEDNLRHTPFECFLEMLLNSINPDTITMGEFKVDVQEFLKA